MAKLARHKKANWHAKRQLSGMRSRRWRRELAQTANGGKVVLSHKFPLAAAQPSEDARARLREEYRLSAAAEENTLFHFFTAVHLAGFRLFAKETAAENHKNAATLRGSSLNADLQKHFGMAQNAAHALREELAKGRRGGNRTAERLFEMLAQEFSADEESQLARFLHEIANEIAQRGLWAPAQKQERIAAIASAGKKMGYDLKLPSLQPYSFPLLWDDGARDFLREAKRGDWAGNSEFAMHQLVSLAAHIARNDRKSEDAVKIKAGDVQKVLLSDTAEYDTAEYNGLSWLFKKGIELLAQPRAAVEKAGLFLGNCAEADLDAIRPIAQALQKAKFNFAKHRKLFGGGLKGWLTLYWDRLDDLQGGLNSIGDAAAPDVAGAIAELEKNERYNGIAEEYEQSVVPLASLQSFMARLIQDGKSAAAALERLQGAGDAIAGKTEVGAIKGFNQRYEEAKGLLIQLAEKLRARHNRDLPAKDQQDKGDFSVAATALPQLKFLLPDKNKGEEDSAEAARHLKRKINRYDGAKVFSPDAIQATVAQDFERLQTLNAARREHWQRIQANYKRDIIGARAAAEQKRRGGWTRAGSCKKKAPAPWRAAGACCKRMQTMRKSRCLPMKRKRSLPRQNCPKRLTF